MSFAALDNCHFIYEMIDHIESEADTDTLT